ncbi:hypothetical protein BXY75_2668 [Ulvibacter antarcticus]|uniref:Uncharacterized protein n=1 Tax=Ulvibacter antarcticus TaxID=442714 RepID=A0A3L9YAX6_9FLAO|nr:hypothetical protein BXY75_2668 [Ulvibacter antarcticus]
MFKLLKVKTKQKQLFGEGLFIKKEPIGSNNFKFKHLK